MGQGLGVGMGTGLHSSMNPPLNTGLNTNLSLGTPQGSPLGINSMGVPINVSNPYTGYGVNPAIHNPYNQFRNPPRNMRTNRINFGSNPYGFSSLYQNPYLNSYPPGIMPNYGYGQTIPPQYSQNLGFDKLDSNIKNN